MSILKRKPKRPKALSIKDYTLSQFVSNGVNDDIFRAVMRHIEPYNKIQGFEFVGFWNLPYKYFLKTGKVLKNTKSTYVDLIKSVIDNNEALIGDKVQNMSLGCVAKFLNAPIEENISSCKMLEIYAFYKYVVDDYFVNAQKFKYMQATKDPDLEAAGVSILDKYGDTLTVDSLAIRYQVQWDDVIKWKFSEVFTKLAMEADRSRVREEYQKIKMKTNATR